MDRIIVIGSSYSGKSSFAQALAQKKQITHIELDQLHWLPNWQERSYAEFRDLVKEAITPAITGDDHSWIIDGNYSVTRDITWPKATQIIWLNHSFPLVLYRAITRSIHRAYTKKPLFAGNIESFKQTFFSRDSIIWWVITTYHKKRRAYDKVLKEQAKRGVTVVELKGQGQVDAFLKSL
jgi:adenylate kinase family enzyme